MAKVKIGQNCSLVAGIFKPHIFSLQSSDNARLRASFRSTFHRQINHLSAFFVNPTFWRMEITFTYSATCHNMNWSSKRKCWRKHIYFPKPQYAWKSIYNGFSRTCVQLPERRYVLWMLYLEWKWIYPLINYVMWNYFSIQFFSWIFYAKRVPIQFWGAFFQSKLYYGLLLQKWVICMRCKRIL